MVGLSLLGSLGVLTKHTICETRAGARQTFEEYVVDRGQPFPSSSSLPPNFFSFSLLNILGCCQQSVFFCAAAVLGSVASATFRRHIQGHLSVSLT